MPIANVLSTINLLSPKLIERTKYSIATLQEGKNREVFKVLIERKRRSSLIYLKEWIMLSH